MSYFLDLDHPVGPYSEHYGDVMVMASKLRGRRFDSRPFHFHVA